MTPSKSLVEVGTAKNWVCFLIIFCILPYFEYSTQIYPIIIFEMHHPNLVIKRKNSVIIIRISYQFALGVAVPALLILDDPFVNDVVDLVHVVHGPLQPVPGHLIVQLHLVLR